MDLQLLAVGLAMLAAAGYVGRSAWRTWFGGCQTGCGKCVPHPAELAGRRVPLTVRPTATPAAGR
jgi:hypothetical protein